MSRLECESWVRARRPASGFALSSRALTSPDRKAEDERLKCDNRQAEKNFRQRVREEEAEGFDNVEISRH